MASGSSPDRTLTAPMWAGYDSRPHPLSLPGLNPPFLQVTTQYHLHTDDFSQDCVRSCTVQRLDNYGGISESVDRQSCYLMRVDEMYAEVTCNTAADFFNPKLKLKNYVKGEQRSFWQAAIYWSLCWLLHRCRHWGGQVFPPSQYFCLHNFPPASPARVRRSSRGSRWSPAPSSSPASSSRPPAKMLCRSEDKRIKCFKIAPKRPRGR